MKACQSTRFAGPKRTPVDRESPEPLLAQALSKIPAGMISKLKRSRAVWPLLLFIALIPAHGLHAQSEPDIDQGMKLYGSFHGGAIDQVSLTNRNLFFRVPLFAYSQRGGELSYLVVLKYNNKNYSVYQTPCPPGTKPGTVQCPLKRTLVFGPNPLRSTAKSYGSSVTIGYELGPGVGSYGAPGIDTGLALNGQEIFVQSSSVITPDGSTHQLAKSDQGLVTLDGSGFLQPTGGSLTDSQGTMFGASIQDRNGNQISGTTSGNGTDTLGRQPPVMPGPGPTGTPPASTANLSSCPALNYPNQAATYAYTWNLPTVNGGTLPLILCYAAVYVRTNISVGALGNYSDVRQSFTMLQSVVFADDNTYWAFEYDAADPNNTSSYGFGDLIKVTLPIGGSISYTWALMYPSTAADEPERGVQTRTVDANDGTGPHTWTYSGNTTVTDPLGNDAVHGIINLDGTSSPYEALTQYYQGSHTGGTLLKTVNTDYQWTVNPYDPAVIGCSVQSDANSVTNVFPIRVTTTLPNGLVSKVETDYDTALTYHGALDGITWNLKDCPATDPGGNSNGDCHYYFYTTPTTNGVTNYTGSYGKVVAKREYDWGQGAPGPLLRQTLTTYQWQVNSAYLSANLMDLPAVVKTQDGSGNLCAETDYYYDEPGYLTTPTPAITTQHATPTAVRGNLTTVTHKLSAAPCSPNATWTNVSSHTNWFDTGEAYQSIDPLGHTATHAYDPAYAGAYPTQTQLPDTVTNGVSIHHVSSGTYDFNTGLVTSYTDQNGQTSNFSYDGRWRLTQALAPTDPLSGRSETDLDFSVLNQIKHSKKQDSSHWIVNYVNVDGVGRTKQTRLVDPAGDDFVDTTYDAAGRVSTVSNPHRSTSGPTDGITTSVYDALGRVTQVVKQDGSTSTVAYDQTSTVSPNTTCSTSSDEALKQRKACSDALGRLIEVDEPTGGAPATPGTGSATVSGSEQSAQVLATPATSGTGSVQVSGAVQWTTVAASGASTGGTTNITISGTEQQNPAGITPGTGSITVNGAEQVIPATYATGSVTINGSLQSKQVQAQAATFATGSVTISGSEQVLNKQSCRLVGGVYTCTPYQVPDNGTVTISVNGHPDSYSFGQSDDSSTVASGLANAINGDGGATVTASASGATVYLTSKSTGSGANYSLASSYTWSSSTFANPSFTTGNSGSALSGGHDQVMTTVYDSGTCSVTVSTRSDGSPWSGSGTTAAGIASALATAINNDGSAAVSASPSANVVNLTAKNPGASGNYPLSSSCTYDSSNFPGASFTTTNSGSTLSGGKDAIYDSGTFSLTVNGRTTTPSTSWNANSTPASLASDLAAKINADAGRFVNASASGATVNLTAIALGSISNYSFSVASTYDSAHFSHASFLSSDSGAALTGGAPNNNAVDSGTMTVSVNGKSYPVSWGQSDNAASIAQKLQTAISADTAVTPALSGGTVTLDARQAATVYSFSTAYSYDSADFAHASFTPSSSISDYGASTISVNGHNDSVSWAGHDSPTTVALALATKINGDASALVNATPSGSTVSLTARTTGASTNYTLGSSTAYDTAHFSASSFSSTNSGTALAGGANAVYNTVYDSGTVTLTVNGTNYSVSYGQNDTQSTIANHLAAAVNAGGLVNAEVANGTLALKADSGGAATNYLLATSSASSQPGQFSSPSFSDAASGAALTGGTDAMSGSLANPLVTLYSYDVLGNLLGVTQKGGAADTTQWRVRNFTYDSLSRLLTAANPESGTITYSYDAAGNLLQKTSPQANQTGSATTTSSFCYDALNRVTGKAYSAQICTNAQLPTGTAAISYAYDAGANAIGHLSSLTDQAGSGSYTYDALGRMAGEQRTLAGISKTMSYEYNLDGSLSKLHYPQRRGHHLHAGYGRTDAFGRRHRQRHQLCHLGRLQPGRIHHRFRQRRQ